MRNKYFAVSILSIICLFLASVVFVLNSRLQELVESTQKQVQVEITPVKRVEFDFKSSQKSDFSFRKVSQKALQSVVYVEATVEVKGKMPKDKQHEQFFDNFDGIIRSTSVGSGVVISDNGYILTNNHVIESALDNKVLIVLNDNRSFVGDIVGTDPSTDLAIVKVDSNDLKGITIGNSDDVFVGDWVLAIGSPFRLRSTVTAGIVSALSRDVSIIEDRMRIENFIQTDAAINRGNSGGGLINEYGELIGINTAIATKTGSYEGYGFAIPINMGIKIARDIIEFGEVQRAYLGVQIVSLTQRRAKQLGLESVSGVEIINAVESGAAYQAGIRSGDVVLSINEKPVHAHNELQAKIAEFRPGDHIDVEVFTNGEKLTKKVTLQGAEKKEIKEWLGLAEPLQDEIIIQEDSLTIEDYDLSTSSIERFSKELTIKVVTFEDKTQLFIQKISPNSAYFMSGLQEGDQLLEINDKLLRSYTDFKIHLQHYQSRKQPVNFKIKREGNKIGYFSLIP